MQIPELGGTEARNSERNRRVLPQLHDKEKTKAAYEEIFFPKNKTNSKIIT